MNRRKGRLLQAFAAMAAVYAGKYDDMFADPIEVERASLREIFAEPNFDSSRPPREIKKYHQPSEKEKALYRETKTLREFKIKGKTVLAYSKKDAIKRLKHRSK